MEKEEVKMDDGTKADATADAPAQDFKKEYDALVGDLQRTRADFENYRKQVEIQKENEKKMVRFNTVAKMLPMIDDMDLALTNYAELAPLKKTLEKSMKELGLKKIDTSVEFNPDLHEAVMAEGEGEKEVISEVLRPGYYYEGEVLRPAMVKVVRQ